MADEIRVQGTLQIRVGTQDYRSNPTYYTDDAILSPFSGLGQTPGYLIVATTGTDVDLSQLTRPGHVWFQNLEAEGGNFLTWGIRDVSTDIFHPLGELGPGEFCFFKFSRDLNEEFGPPATGTGTTGPVNFFHLKADTASVPAVVHAFEK